MTQIRNETKLRRVLNLPLLVFYGVGVTIGAGIFALIGEVVKVAGDFAPMAFIFAGLIAGATGISYAILSAIYPRAGGEAVFVNNALGSGFARLVGYGVTTTALISSAVISLSFSGYLGSILPVPGPILVIGILLILATVAFLGVRESVMFAAVITLLEAGTLVILIFFGSSALADPSVLAKAVTLPASLPAISLVLSASVISFFAYIGFEDIVNMAEETVNPTSTLPLAIVITLGITIVLYTLVSLIAVAMPDREALITSGAPLTTLYESVTGFSGKPVSAMASIAMINGILVQIVMASRVIYGMTKEGLAPAVLGKLDSQRQTPLRAIIVVTTLIAILALAVPLLKLAQATSLVTLVVFLLVNLALWRLGNQNSPHPKLYKWRNWGLFGALLTGGLLLTEVLRLLAI